MHPLLPHDEDLDDAGLAARYAYPESLDRTFVRVGFVASADGAVAVEGRSAGLGSPADHRVFLMQRRLADVVLAGAGTVRTEDYGGARSPSFGRDTPPPIAVVAGSAQLDPTSRLFTDTEVPPIILTLASTPSERREVLAAAGGDVVTFDRLTPTSCSVSSHAAACNACSARADPPCSASSWPRTRSTSCASRSRRSSSVAVPAASPQAGRASTRAGSSSPRPCTRTAFFYCSTAARTRCAGPRAWRDRSSSGSWCLGTFHDGVEDGARAAEISRQQVGTAGSPRAIPVRRLP